MTNRLSPAGHAGDRFGRLLKPGELRRTLFWAALVGIVGGLCSAGFRQAIFAVQWLLTGHTGSLVGISLSLESWQRLLIPTVGGITAGLVLHFGHNLTGGDKPTDYMEALTVADGAIPVAPSLVKSASSLMTIASGRSIGREGSMVQLAAVAASWLGQRLDVSGPSLRLLTACGAAAGLASVYDAPIAGALFVSDIILDSIAIESLSPLLLSAAAATVVSRSLGSAETYFRVSSLDLISAWEILPYLAMGVALGVSAPAFVWLLRVSREGFGRLHVPIYVRLRVGGLVVGAILGSLVGTGVEHFLPGQTAGAPAFAVVAMSGFLAATTGAPMTAMLMVFEMTLDHGIVLPLIITSVIAALVARRLSKASLYSDALTPALPVG